jgi:hypothetical protein
MSSAEFGATTPRMLDALLKRKIANDRKAFLCAGIVASATVNSGFCRPKNMLSPVDFIPGESSKQDKIESSFDLTQLSEEEQANFVIGQFFSKVDFRVK